MTTAAENHRKNLEQIVQGGQEKSREDHEECKWAQGGRGLRSARWSRSLNPGKVCRAHGGLGL